MLAIVYLIITAVFGLTLVNLAVPDVRRLFVACAPSKDIVAFIPNTLFTVPAGVLVGVIVTGFINYYSILGLSYFVDSGALCKRIGMIITFAVLLWLTLTNLIIINKRRMKRIINPSLEEIPPHKYTVGGTVFYGLFIALITAAVTFLMLYTYRASNGELNAGFSTFSDLAPHTAMVSSFSKGFNFPTQYMHFSGDGIQYHFLFYFFAGMLNYGGLPIDVSLNVLSIVTMVSALILLSLLAFLLSGRRFAFVTAPVLVLFRSAWNVFDHILVLLKSETLSEALKDVAEFEAWYEVTPYDSWGIWAINVYPNQRHLMLGVGLIIMMIIMFIPFVRRMCISMMRAGSFGGSIKAFVFSKSSWVPRKYDPLHPVMLTILASLVVIVMPYFHGSALIAMLLVLFGMAIFSECRLLYLIVAVCAVASSYIQTMAFSGGSQNVVNFSFKPGFILEDATFGSVIIYLLTITGLTLVLALLTALVMMIFDIRNRKPVYRTLLFLCFLLPLAFGFTFQVTLEMLANHKFIQITLILVDAFVAMCLANMVMLPFKIRSKEDVDEEPVLAPVISSTGSLSEDSAVRNLADDDLDPAALDLPEEIDLPDEIEDPDEEEVGLIEAGEDGQDDEEDTGAVEASEERSDDGPEETSEGTSDGEEIPDEAVAGVRPGSELIALDMQNDLAVSEAVPEEDDEEGGDDEGDEDSDKADTESIPEDIIEEEPNEDPKEEDIAAAAVVEVTVKKKKHGIPLGAFVLLQSLSILLAVIFLVGLTATGISEWCTYYNLNKNKTTVNLNSPVTQWIVENTNTSDVFLTPMWSFEDFYLAGRPSYYGWPYYAWSAGHDTDTRDTIYGWLITGCHENIDEFVRYCKERNIKYLIASPDYEGGAYADGAVFDYDFFADHLAQVASFNEYGIRIYKIY